MKPLLIGLLVLGLVGCVKPVEPPFQLSPDDLAVVQSAVRNSLKDPDSARFGAIAAAHDSQGRVQVCGWVNAKNSFGGYTGSQVLPAFLRELRRQVSLSRISRPTSPASPG